MGHNFVVKRDFRQIHRARTSAGEPALRIDLNGNGELDKDEGLILHKTEDGWTPVGSLSELQEQLSQNSLTDLKVWVDARRGLTRRRDGAVQPEELASPSFFTPNEVDNFVENNGMRFTYKPKETLQIAQEGENLAPVLIVNTTTDGFERQRYEGFFLGWLPKDGPPPSNDLLAGELPKAFAGQEADQLFLAEPDSLGRALNETQAADQTASTGHTLTNLRASAALRRGSLEFADSLRELAAEATDPRHQKLAQVGAGLLESGSNGGTGTRLYLNETRRTALGATALNALTSPIALSVEQTLASFGAAFMDSNQAASEVGNPIFREIVETTDSETLELLAKAGFTSEYGEVKRAAMQAIANGAADENPTTAVLHLAQRAGEVSAEAVDPFLAYFENRLPQGHELLQAARANPKEATFFLRQLEGELEREAALPREEEQLLAEADRLWAASKRIDTNVVAPLLTAYKSELKDPEKRWVVDRALGRPSLVQSALSALQGDDFRSGLLEFAESVSEPARLKELLSTLPCQRDELYQAAENSEDPFFIREVLRHLMPSAKPE